MPFILDTEINENVPLFIALQKIYGVGRKRAVFITKKLGLSRKSKLVKLPYKKTNNLINVLKSSKFLMSNKLKAFLNAQLKIKIFIKSYKGLRRLNGFPIRGQRTRTNAKTAKKSKSKL